MGVDFARDSNKMKFVIGFIFSITKGVVSGLSKLQYKITLSIPKVKYMITIEARKEDT